MTPRTTATPSRVRRGALLGGTVLVLLTGCVLPPGGGEPAGGPLTGVLDDAAADRAPPGRHARGQPPAGGPGSRTRTTTCSLFDVYAA